MFKDFSHILETYIGFFFILPEIRASDPQLKQWDKHNISKH